MPKNSGKNNPWSGVPSYDEVPVRMPRIVLANGQVKEMPPTDEDRFAQAVQERYGDMPADKLAAAVSSEMGLDPYKIRVNLNSKKVIPGAWGQFSREKGKLQVAPPSEDFPAYLHKPTVVHELAHVADAVADPGFFSAPVAERVGNSVDDSKHFSLMGGEGQMGDSMHAQHLLEQGLPADPQVMGNMPWLRQVAPMSSSKLANPWAELIRRGKAVPPAAWNQSYDDK